MQEIIAKLQELRGKMAEALMGVWVRGGEETKADLYRRLDEIEELVHKFGGLR